MLSLFNKKRIPAPSPIPADILCPICESSKHMVLECGKTPFVTGASKTLPEVRNCRKFQCSTCGHIWTPWLNQDLGNVSAIYDGIFQESSNESIDVNFRSAYQLELLTLAFAETGGKKPCLDFGCGPNFSVTQLLNKLGLPAYCCDISNHYPYDGKTFFRHSYDTRWTHQFGGIASVDVIEHLGNTVETWRYFNQILQPEGVMYHIFPTTLHYDLRHHYVTNAFHLCIFSEQSLTLLCEKTGFEFCGMVPSIISSSDPTLQNIFHFKKKHSLT
ncbi:MAG: methyltransferase domain-containing protein [bacterium]